MKKIMNSILGSVILTLAIAALLPQITLAQVKTQEESRMEYVMDPNTDVEVFRQELTNYLSEMQNTVQFFESFPAIREQYEKMGMKPAQALEQSKEDVAKMPAEDLVKMRAVYAKFSGWREAPRVLNEMIKAKFELQQQQRSGGTNKRSRGNTAEVITPDACPDLSATPSFADIAITKGFEIAADAVMEALPTDFLSIVAREVSVAARAGLKASVLAEETLRSQYDDCHGLSSDDVQGIVDNAKTEIINNDNDNKNTIVQNDNSNNQTVLNSLNTKTNVITTAITNAQTSINDTTNASSTAITTAITDAKTAIINNDNSNKTAIVNNDNANTTTLNTAITNARNTIVQNDNANTTNIINNDNSNRTQIINNDNANTATLNTAITNAKTEIINNDNANTKALMDALLRSQIEADLATESNAVKVAWYMTPTAKGGHLDLVQQIVTQTLANIVAAGGSIGNAQSFLDQANADKAAGRFKSAYDNYRKAYKAAAN